MSIERITPGDWRTWRDLRLAALAESSEAFGSRLSEWQDATEAEWRARLTWRGGAYFVGYLDGEPVGMVSGVPDDEPSTVFLMSMWVAPTARGHAVGDALVAAVRDYGRTIDADLFALEVMATNLTARALYARHGFAVVGDADCGISNDQPGVRMLTTVDPEATDRSAIVLRAADHAGLEYDVVRHGPVRSLEEAAAVRGVPPSAIVKSMVVRVSEDDYRFVLVPGDREIDWSKLRALLGVNRMSMPDAATARGLTGFVRGTITPLGSVSPLPVIADERVTGAISLGAGGHGVSLSLVADALVRALAASTDATTADVTRASNKPT